MSVYEVLPHVNGGINATNSVLLLAGLLLVKRGNVAAHRACMVTAFLLSIAFLASYVVLHLEVGATSFRGQGAARAAYFTILITHMLLAATVPFLVSRTIWLAHKRRFDEHRRLARVAFPVWLYVAVTGVVVYMFLYHWYPAPGS